ncbi:methylenetetrahydrofolate--tRNA-(uracil(54)-C(5))-methyltransferase (FADH(2)-oxidizing) TrmFO [[Acholeplasma] multilocale]|uniref:methylenetetrahydrofolate--tRNA-(uracil(54)- C(5))-methyltransferase (FADH(2)-oxidizing) TrmFO n=1 Tax=[Acholeplasma] multilocale TaxID=264638 RepID=UPI00047A7B99|nr:methylenetetrahydrofolate--tRNA-(uracil(54)-C(5))-methyltransferase (FADH(2)-oxidizing) TrmFO [[Acholeplasma] multilocale]
MKKINIIGAGLSGSEAAYQLAKKGYSVNLFEVKKLKRNPVQVTDNFGELVCSNSLRSDDLGNAVGTLKEEMRMLDSLIIKAAEFARVPAGGSLAVDRDKFSGYITNEMNSNPLINVIDQEVEKIDRDAITLIASGPLTTDKLQKEINEILGNDDFYFFDAVAPIIAKDSINMDIAFRKNRYEKGETEDYINCPMNKEQYEKFYNELINAETAIAHLEEDQTLKYFEGCMPVEGMAKRGEKTLLFGPMKPQGLRNLDGTNNYAVVQLRQDDAKDSLYNIVGFQTNLKWAEQKRVFSLIPGLENAEFVRYGVMHKNNFINSPKLLNKHMQLKDAKDIFFAGQITGVEGYVESTVSGILAALNIDKYIKGEEMVCPPSSTVTGALIHYINNASSTNFQPMKANWGIVDEIDIDKRQGKPAKKEAYSKRALEEMRKFIELI